MEKKVEKSELSKAIDSYHKASKACTCGCIYNHVTQKFNISNDVWVSTYVHIQNARSTKSDFEKSKIMKQELYSKLKESKFKSVSDHVKLSFMTPFVLPDDNLTRQCINLCESCYVSLQGHIGDRTWAAWKKEIKSNILVAGYAAEATTLFAQKCAENTGKGRYENIAEAQKALEPLGFTEVEHFQWACVPDSDASREAYLWLHNFIGLVGNNAPNRKDKIQLPGIYTKESIHKIYSYHVSTMYSGNEHEPLEIRAFETLWNNIFPNVTISRHCQVDGKCFHCHSIYERLEVFNCEDDLVSIRKLATIHKILIEMQRGAYISNRTLAQDHPDLYMSVIIDGMSQDHCILPYYAGKAKESTVMKQKIVGAKQHGFSRTLYRVFPHVKSGGNLACEVLLHEIESRIDYCLAEGKPFPRILYLQIDGGPENTAKHFYAFLEDLVRQGVFDSIEAARLPVGHTHEDIDAMFGVLWRAAQGKTIITPDEWKNMALAAFNQS